METYYINMYLLNYHSNTNFFQLSIQLNKVAVDKMVIVEPSPTNSV